MTLSKQTLNAKLMELSTQFDAYKNVEDITVTSAIESYVSSEAWSCKKYKLGNTNLYHLTGEIVVTTTIPASTELVRIPIENLHGLISINAYGNTGKIGWTANIAGATKMYNGTVALGSGPTYSVDSILIE